MEKKMKTRTSKLNGFSLITLGFIFLMSAVMSYAAPAQSTYPSSQNRLSFALKGGMAHSKSQGGLMEVDAEILFPLSTFLRIGFGVGYLSDWAGMHMGGGMGHMSGGMRGSLEESFSDHSHDFRVIPLTLSLYYTIPVRPYMDIFMVGGAGFYLGSFRDISTQRKNGFGPYAGFGFDFNVADRIVIVTEGIFRFASLQNFTSELHPGFSNDTDEQVEGFWHFHHGHGEWHFHEEHEDLDQMMNETSLFNINLNGFSIRAGIRFTF